MIKCKCWRKYHRNKRYLEKYCQVLIENQLNGQKKYFGRTRYMTPVIFDSNDCQPGELKNIKIKNFNRKNLFGSKMADKIKAA